MRYSKYADKIQLHFAGKGPKQKKYQKIADRLMNDGILKHRPTFGFYRKYELKELMHRAYLYIHCAWVEVEGLSCAEAIAEGVVPIIAEGRLTAASQFALDQRSLFPESDSKALAQKIGWWIEHPEERARMSVEYANSAVRYAANDSTSAIIKMYEEALSR